jgi:hypothetical protein
MAMVVVGSSAAFFFLAAIACGPQRGLIRRAPRAA